MQGKTPAEIEREQEELLKKKFPGLGSGKPRGPAKVCHSRSGLILFSFLLCPGRRIFCNMGSPSRINFLSLAPQDHKYFDSADYSMQKDAMKNGRPPIPEEDKVEELPAKLKPSPPASRRVSHMDNMETSRDFTPH